MAKLVKSIGPLGFPFTTPDPWLFAVYHKDDFPAGDEQMRVPGGKRGNGADFELNERKRWRFYHGDRIPGFPQHPHKGFETFTIVLQGAVDHTDSLGSSGRYGKDDAQWMTAGSGIVHGENFPLIEQDPAKGNPLVLYQLWINLPRRSKGAAPGYSMSWGEDLVTVAGEGGAVAKLFAGSLGGATASIKTPADSWAADASNDVAAVVIDLPPGGAAAFTVPPAAGGAAINRMVYVVEGEGVVVGDVPIKGSAEVDVRSDAPLRLANPHATRPAQVLLLQGRPIGEPVAQRGPFVMSTQAELGAAFREYQETQFGGWPWADDAPVFPRERGRFASRGAGHPVEYPPGTAPREASLEVGAGGAVA